MIEEPRIERLFRTGGQGRVNLLGYAVQSVTMELLMHFLVGEYRFHPRVKASVALYDAFCAPGALARIAMAEIVPARTLRLAAGIEALRARLREFENAATVAEPGQNFPGPSPPAADRALFDGLMKSMWADPDGALRRAERDYDPSLTPEANLPGGRMTPAQRIFVNDVWRPRVRPLLVDAGFWQLSSID